MRDNEAIERTAWALLEAHRAGTTPLTLKGGSFCGQLAVDPTQALTEKQQRWFGKLIEKAGLPALELGGDA